MPSHFFVRKSYVDDAKAVFELIKELAEYEKAPQEVSLTLAEFVEHGWGNKPVFDCWVAISNGIVVGMALCYVRYSTWKGPMLYLEDLYIKPDFRRDGMGKQLFEQCINYAKQNNYVGICWQVLEWNELAINFYKKYNCNLDPEWLNGKIMFD